MLKSNFINLSIETPYSSRRGTRTCLLIALFFTNQAQSQEPPQAVEQATAPNIYCRKPISVFVPPGKDQIYLFKDETRYMFQPNGPGFSLTNSKAIPSIDGKADCSTTYFIDSEGSTGISNSNGSYKFFKKWEPIPGSETKQSKEMKRYSIPAHYLSDGSIILIGGNNRLFEQWDPTNNKVILQRPYSMVNGKPYRGQFWGAVTADVDGRLICYFPTSGRLFIIDYFKKSIDEIIDLPWQVWDMDINHTDRLNRIRVTQGQWFQPSWPDTAYFISGPDRVPILVGQYLPAAGRGLQWYAYRVGITPNKVENIATFPSEASCIWPNNLGQLAPFNQPQANN